MLDFFLRIFIEFWDVLGEMSPYLLFGFLVAGALSALISAKVVERNLGGRGLLPAIKAALFGIPLPLCSCGVIPVAASLRRSGASRSATTSFLLSTPQTGVDSVMVTFSLLGVVFAVFRPIAALFTGIVGGALVEFFDRGNANNSEMPDKCGAGCYIDVEPGGKIAGAMKYGFLTLPQDIGKPMIAGLALAGIISAAVPDHFFAGLLGTGILAMLVMMVVGIPMYVCATASVPLAAAFIAKGVSPGAALVFLMTGPATNAAALTTIWKVLGRRTALIYLGAVAGSSLAAGLTLDYVFLLKGAPAAIAAPWMMPGIIKNLSAVLLLALLGYGIYNNYKTSAPEDKTKGEFMETITLKIKGMSCSHCADSVSRALKGCPGVETVQVDLKGGKAVVSGEGFDLERLRESVEKSGYNIVN